MPASCRLSPLRPALQAMGGCGFLLWTSTAGAHVSFTAPAPSSRFDAGQQVTLKWQIVDHGDAFFDIDFALDVGQPWVNVVKHWNKQGSGPFSYAWTVPRERCDYCRLRIGMTTSAGQQHWEDQMQLAIGSPGTDSASPSDAADGGCSASGNKRSSASRSVLLVALALLPRLARGRRR